MRGGHGRTSKGKTGKRVRHPQSAKTTAQSLWRFDLARLRPGDVLLERGARLMSTAIRAVDRGKYSHALIFLGGTTFLEAVGAGARVISYVRLGIADPSAWLLLRYPDEQIAELAAKKARSLAHKEYGKAAALRSILPIEFRDDPTRIFCSQLVAVAYERAGAVLVKGKEARQVTPRLLHEKSTLQSLPRIPLRKAHTNIPARDRDTEYVDSATAADMLISQNVFKAVQPVLERLITAFKIYPHPPGSLIELFDFLVQAEIGEKHKEVAPLIAALEGALDQENYFALHSNSARQAEAALVREIGLAMSQKENTQQRQESARLFFELANDYVQMRTRFEESEKWFQCAFQASGEPLWSRLAHMRGEAARATQKLIVVAQDGIGQLRPILT